MQIKGGVQRHIEGMQIAVVDADQRRRQRQRIIQLLPIMNLHQYIQPDLMGNALELLHLVFGQTGSDQQDAVRTDGPAFVNLIGRDHEVLADHRQTAGITGGHQVVLVAHEEVVIGEHGQTGRSAVFVALGDHCRLERIAQNALAR